MSYTFTNKPFPWTKTGSEPTAAELQLGFQGGMALPAAFLNGQWNKTYLAVKEVQDRVEDGTILTKASSGGDFAECYEWLDSINGEDRCGLFVTVDGNKIRLANAGDDYILGAISATACLVGDAYGSGGELRTKNPQFGIVGIIGKLYVHDDGTCKVNGYCKPADGGIAAESDAGYRVIERVNGNTIRIIFR